MSSTERALKGVADAFTPTTSPLLLLQGTNDSMIAPAAAQAFAARPDALGRAKLITYKGLGHSLGRAQSIQEDALLPMADGPLDDMVVWLTQKLRLK
jgi:fermentation-respiration switch protein FrsA (DUF1100 family)